MSSHSERHDMASKIADYLKASMLAAFEDFQEVVNVGVVRFCAVDESGGGAEEIHLALFDTDYAIRIRVDHMDALDSVQAIGDAVAEEMLQDGAEWFQNNYMNGN